MTAQPKSSGGVADESTLRPFGARKRLRRKKQILAALKKGMRNYERAAGLERRNRERKRKTY